MSVLGVIPVRMASVRLPGKPLRMIGNQSLVERVWRQAKGASSIDHLVIATDSAEIQKSTVQFGAAVVMTGEVPTGSDRVAQAYQELSVKDGSFDCIVNIQGDMPFISASAIDSVVSKFIRRSKDFGMGTMAVPIFEEEEFMRAACVKVVLGNDDRALYFSRAPVPYPRNKDRDGPLGYKHIGLYVFRPDVLVQMSGLPQSLIEKREGLEQLRLLAAGVSVLVTKVPREEMEPSIEVDTLEDLEAAQNYVKTSR